MLLGCGDPRHILYTLWCMQQAGDLSSEQKLHTTTCDIEPSIIARNIVLYKLIHNKSDPAMVWSLFYGKLVDELCLNLLISCASNLHAVGTSLEVWHQSPFGRLVRFCDEHTYSIVHQIWAVYAKVEVSTATASKMDQCQCRISAALPKGSVLLTAAAQALPCCKDSIANCKTHSDIVLTYASDGLVPANIYSLNAPLMMNPMIFRGVEQIADLHSRPYIRVSSCPCISSNRQWFKIVSRKSSAGRNCRFQ